MNVASARVRYAVTKPKQLNDIDAVRVKKCFTNGAKIPPILIPRITGKIRTIFFICAVDVFIVSRIAINVAYKLNRYLRVTRTRHVNVMFFCSLLSKAMYELQAEGSVSACQ